jgi:hypothetical protein
MAISLPSAAAPLFRDITPHLPSPKSGTVNDLMFDPRYQDQLVTFDQREERACELGRDLTAWLLERHTNADPQVRPDEQRLSTCPKCGQPGQRVTAPEDPLPQRRVTSLTGEVTLQREQWRCTTCRVVFFPLGPETPAGNRGL